MPNKFKYNKTGSEANSIFKGNWAIDTTANNIGDGPSSATSFYNGAEIPGSGYTIYSQGKVFKASTDTELLGKANALGANVGSASAALTWFAGQPTHMVLNRPIENIVTSGLVLNFDPEYVSSFVNSEPTTNLIPTPTINAYPTTGNGWGTYNTNQYCGNNGCAVYWDIPAIASVTDNIVTTVSAHTIRSFDVINPQTTGGGVNAGQQYLAKKISATSFSLHDYNSSQDGSQGYLNPATGRFKVHDSFWLDQRVAVNASSFPTKWFGNPHQPNSALVKEIISGGFNVAGNPVTDCVRLHWFRSDTTDGMSYGVDASVTIGVPVTTSFWVRAASPSAVGQYISFQHYNYGGIAGADGYGFAAYTGAQGEWVRRSFTFTPTHNTLISYFFPNTGDMKIDVANIQIEQQSSITPFVAGSRAQNTTAYDLASNANHGTLINGPTYTGTTFGTIVFDGIDDYINIPSFTNQPSTGITCEAWIKPTKGSVGTGTQRGGVISATSNMYLGIIDSTDGGTTFSLHWANNTDNGSQRPYSWNGQIPNNVWTHIAGTWDGSTSIAYVNGNEVWRAAQTGTIPASTYVLGTYGGSLTDGVHNFKGEIALARIYNRALTQSEIGQNLSTGSTRFAL
jgi:hypothetical protein